MAVESITKVVEGRIEKPYKRGRDRKLSSVELEKVVEDQKNTDSNIQSPCCGEKQDKKQVGVVIDGRTFTCATCKAGHRVGVCKHGKERPMKPTHPPGRPSAGQPKKVICDCPKNCSCTKKDCKCPRTCNCTQSMFMLVYLPAPGMEDHPEDDTGTWKIGESVTTDLKGNILSPEEIQERKRQKETIKMESPGKNREGNQSSKNLPQQSLSSSEAKPVASGGCCKHKEKIAEQNIAAKAVLKTESVPTSPSKGCNCGAKCSCHFCPEHPNNSVSINLAREQYMHFRTQHFSDDSDMISFTPNLPMGASCMGGQPRFAMSTMSTKPSAAQLAQTFGAPDGSGYIIGYPVEQLYDTEIQNMTIPTITHTAGSFTNGFSNGQGIPQEDIASPQHNDYDNSFGMLHGDFNIGNAFVASAGPHGWQSNYFPTDNWSYTPTNFNGIQFNPEPGTLTLSQFTPIVDLHSANSNQSNQTHNLSGMSMSNDQLHSTLQTPLHSGYSTSQGDYTYFDHDYGPNISSTYINSTFSTSQAGRNDGHN